MCSWQIKYEQELMFHYKYMIVNLEYNEFAFIKIISKYFCDFSEIFNSYKIDLTQAKK